METSLQHILKNIPHQPGVYRMKNADQTIIYIGKAKDLFKRVNSYFKKNDQHTTRTIKMVEQIADIEYTVTSSELEALILETNLIKEKRPKYNILMKDDKNFAYIKITTNEDYPRILIVRKVLNDKAKYFGPKTAASKIYSTLSVLRKIFPYRNCNLTINDKGPASSNDVNKKRMVEVSKAGIKYPCLDLHIKRCLAPCVGKPTKEEYLQVINNIVDLLEGKYQAIVNVLKQDMTKAALDKKFEQAARIRDQINTIESLYQKQLASNPDHQNSDIINYYLEDEQVYFNLFQIREGKLIDQQNLILKQPTEEQESATEYTELITSFLQQYYTETTNFPEEILLPEQLDNQELLVEWLSQLANHKVKLHTPQKGKKDKLLELSLENAISFAKQTRARWEGESKNDREEALQKLGQILSLPKPPKRLECYDISHLSGTHTVASMSVFENGFPKKDQYRHFKVSLENPGSPDDFASMEEVLYRRLKYLKTSIANKGISITKIKPSKTKLDATSTTAATEEIISPEQPLPDQYQIKLNKEKISQFSVHLSSNKLKTFLTDFLTPDLNFEEILNKVIEKFNCRRLYLTCPENQQKEYEKLGFQKVQISLPELPCTAEQINMTYDKTRNFQDNSFKKKPDLIVIDGGKGQLSHAFKALEDYHLSIPIISLAKREEEFFLPNQSESIKLTDNDPTRLMIQHLRDEAHRFAIEYNRKLRKKDYTSSQLEEIPGIGKLLTQKLLRHFGSVDQIKQQAESEIAKIVGNKNAIKIKSKLN